MDRPISITMKGSRVGSQRRKLMEAGKNCCYCDRETNPAVKTLYPTVEHFIPRHIERQTGERKLVLACRWCDKTKGMLTGHEYLAIVQEELSKYPRFEVAQMYIAVRCRQLNRERHGAYMNNKPGLHESNQS